MSTAYPRPDRHSNRTDPFDSLRSLRACEIGSISDVRSSWPTDDNTRGDSDPE
jgi:hypothetical protein